MCVSVPVCVFMGGHVYISQAIPYLDLRDKEKIKNLSGGGKSMYIGKKIWGQDAKKWLYWHFWVYRYFSPFIFHYFIVTYWRYMIRQVFSCLWLSSKRTWKKFRKAKKRWEGLKLFMTKLACPDGVRKLFGPGTRDARCCPLEQITSHVLALVSLSLK